MSIPEITSEVQVCDDRCRKDPALAWFAFQTPDNWNRCNRCVFSQTYCTSTSSFLPTARNDLRLPRQKWKQVPSRATWFILLSCVFFVSVKKVHQDNRCSEISQANETACWQGVHQILTSFMASVPEMCFCLVLWSFCDLAQAMPPFVAAWRNVDRGNKSPFQSLFQSQGHWWGGE